MNPESIGTTGYIGLALALAALLTWLVYWGFKSRFLARLGFVLALGALAFAEIHSAIHVDRIELDPSIKLAEMKAEQEKRRQDALDLRGSEVAQIRFPEDDGDEFLDKAGLEESDLEFYDSLDQPIWKKEKKTRSTGGSEDEGLEALIDTEKTEGGADVEALEAEKGPEPILMDESEVAMARRLDRWNGRFSLALPIFGLMLLGYDYLRRFNRYAKASLPLPLPSALPGAITPMPAVVERPDPPRRPLVEELEWIVRRGDSFIYMTDEPLKAGSALEHLQPLAEKQKSLEVIRLEDGDGVGDDLVFESLWFGRASFIVDSTKRAQGITDRFVYRLSQRAGLRAHVRQVAHVVWDYQHDPVSGEKFESLTRLARTTGWSIFLCKGADALPDQAVA